MGAPVPIECDMGESYGIFRVGDDEALMPLVDMANVACGFHAGDPRTIARTIELASEHGVAVGAHPSYPDVQGFGRRAMDMPADELAAAVTYQIGALTGFLDAAGLELNHVKAHGALYGRSARDREVAEAVLEGAAPFGVPLMGMAGTCHEEVWADARGGFLAEYYTDLDYDDDGSLIITREHVAYDPDEAARRALRAVTEGRATTTSGGEIPMRADCVCIHSDTPGAVELARAVRNVLHAHVPS
jgi:5-oxoprolinase (ATP-hydrolysing) subunit A